MCCLSAVLRSKVFHLGSVEPDALLGNCLEFHGPFAVVL